MPSLVKKIDKRFEASTTDYLKLTEDIIGNLRKVCCKLVQTKPEPPLAGPDALMTANKKFEILKLKLLTNQEKYLNIASKSC